MNMIIVTLSPSLFRPDRKNQDPRDLPLASRSRLATDHKAGRDPTHFLEKLPILHIKATHNNTMLTITDPQGRTLAWTSAVSYT